MNHIKQYNDHKSGAKVRGIPFLLTFEEWLQIWEDSGHFHERGNRRNQYCMARFGDVGPYAVGNVKIILHSENSKEGNIGKSKPKSDATRSKMSAVKKGIRKSKEFKEAVSGSMRKAWFQRSAEQRDQVSRSLSKALTGRVFTDSWRQKLSIAAKRRWNKE